LAAELAIDPGTAWNLHLIAAANAANRCDDLLIAVPSLGVNVAVDLAAAMPVGRNFARSALFRLKRRVGCIRSRGHAQHGSKNYKDTKNHSCPPVGFDASKLRPVAAFRQAAHA